MKNITTTIGLVLALATSAAQAIPTLFFNGDIAYDSSTRELSVTSDLISTFDIAPAPELIGIGSLSFDALLTSSFSFGGWSVGSFETIAGQDDLIVKDANSIDLLTGNFSSLTMSGVDGTKAGTITGTIMSTGGSLAAQFGSGQLIALQFNLSTSFSEFMFKDNFAGKIDGAIEGESVSVPEPSLLALLSLGIILLGFVNKKTTHVNV